MGEAGKGADGFGFGKKEKKRERKAAGKSTGGGEGARQKTQKRTFSEFGADLGGREVGGRAIKEFLLSCR